MLEKYPVKDKHENEGHEEKKESVTSEDSTAMVPVDIDAVVPVKSIPMIQR